MLSQMSIMKMPQLQRRVRSPKHKFYCINRPWQLQPFMCAPVLPGETLKNLVMQARVVTDPIDNPLIGWWCEHYWFYVKLRDLYARDVLTDMLLNPAAVTTALDDPTDVYYMHVNGAENPAINYSKKCMEVIVENYFRNEGEQAADYVIDTMYAASVSEDTWLDSAANDDTIRAASTIDQNLVSAVAGQGDATTAVLTSEIDKAMREYEFARQNKVTDMTFEDWCEQFGVRMPKAELFKPELIRYSRDWTYPSNTIDPTNGVARSACSWAVQVRADKDRAFKEPGFIVGVACTRPKIYFKNMRSDPIAWMNNAFRWLPAMLANDPWASYVGKMTAGDGPLAQNTDDYWFDLKDLFIHGSQFVNYAFDAVTNQNVVALPNATLTNKRYPSSTDADNLFVTKTAGTGKVKQDGACTLHVLGRQVDTSPMSSGTNVSL